MEDLLSQINVVERKEKLSLLDKSAKEAGMKNNIFDSQVKGRDMAATMGPAFKKNKNKQA